MEKTYVIAWKSKSRGTVGKGKALFSREEAEQAAKELNKDHPDFVHEPLDIGGPSIGGTTQPEITEQFPAESLITFPSEEEVIA